MKVFEDLRDAFRQAVENFRYELNRDDVSGSADALLSEMRSEVIDARAYVHRLEKDLRRAMKQVEAEREEALVCRRREELARKIGDEETARIAGDFAAKHESRKAVLERKMAALAEEVELRRKEVSEMTARLKEARGRKEGLTAEAGRARARDAVRSRELFDELDRMGEEIDRNASYAESAEAVSDLFPDEDRPPHEAPSPDEPHATGRAPTAEERLAELKRQMEDEARGSGSGAEEGG